MTEILNLLIVYFNYLFLFVSFLLVLCIYEFLFNSGDRISKVKIIMEVLRIKNLKYDRNFELTNCLF